ncbi:MAG: hypothetical protein A2X58_03650 [Nitrospirae bacterium GWC2_56_14]|nr:MAG: hypothetical protein A2X58_03650 [Nitrospirae bacterium GWC2_56_14]
MKHVLNKPRVFLSHSAKDKSFIDRLCGDLRKCQIDPWLDTEEIRDGKPWLKVIFEDGIPTCDAVLVYFTENSIISPMVAKEIDAALIQSLSACGISFLPYVEKAELRSSLRVDLRTLQCREFNRKNYNTILPSVVSEIWRSHMENSIESASLKQKNKILELELELEKLKQSKPTVFESSENEEFPFLHNRLKRIEKITVSLYTKVANSVLPVLVRNDIYEINILDMLVSHVKSGSVQIDYHHFNWEIDQLLKESASANKYAARNQYYTGAKVNPDLIVELRTYGFLRGVTRTKSNGRDQHIDEITDKFYRFVYWLEYNGGANSNIDLQLFKLGEEKETTLDAASEG